MKAYLLFSIILFFQSSFIESKFVLCETRGHFTNGLVEAFGSVSCSYNWGFPRFVVGDESVEIRVELIASEAQKQRLIEFKTLVSKIDDPVKDSILEQLAIAETFFGNEKLDFQDYKKFQVKYYNLIDTLTVENLQEIIRFFK